MDGTLKADERLPTEDDLAKHFGVSRPTIREALKRLSAQNLIRSRRGPAGGTFVNRPTCEELSSDVTTAAALLVSMGEVDIAEVMEARREFEVVCARLAAERRLVSELDVMAAEIEMQKDSTLPDAEFCASDVRFHRALADASHNPAIRFAMFSVIEALQSIDKLERLRSREREEIVKQHERILKALSAQDADGAAAAVTDQIEYLLERFNVALGWTYVQRLVERGQAQDVSDQPGVTSGRGDNAVAGVRRRGQRRLTGTAPVKSAHARKSLLGCIRCWTLPNSKMQADWHRGRRWLTCRSSR